MEKSKLCSLKGYDVGDTIAAIATYPAKAALGVIKVSGKRAIPIVSRIFRVRKNKDIKNAKTYTVHYGWIIEKPKTKKQDVKIIDEVLVTIMRGPYTYTREDVVEISSHGGVMVLNKIIELLTTRGARLANPGEFTYRAVKKGRIDLFQAQGISDLVEAQTEDGASMAMRQLKGETSLKAHAVREELKRLCARLEAHLQFPDEEVEVSLKDIKKSVTQLRERTESLLKGSKTADILKTGLRCVICGRANTGKSTLFNRLLKQERALVTHIKGTTRDVVEEGMHIKGIPLRISDTAGIVEPVDLIGKRAVEKSYQAIDAADLILFLLDYSKPLDKDDFLIFNKVKDKNTIIVVNKIDVNKGIDLQKVRTFKKPMVRMSALKGVGLSQLEDALYSAVYDNGVVQQDDLISLRQWQKNILQEGHRQLSDAEKYINEGHPLDFVHFTLEGAHTTMGRFNGQAHSEEILSEIFSNFCIGK